MAISKRVRFFFAGIFRGIIPETRLQVQNNPDLEGKKLVWRFAGVDLPYTLQGYYDSPTQLSDEIVAWMKERTLLRASHSEPEIFRFRILRSLREQLYTKFVLPGIQKNIDSYLPKLENMLQVATGETQPLPISVAGNYLFIQASLAKEIDPDIYALLLDVIKAKHEYLHFEGLAEIILSLPLMNKTLGPKELEILNLLLPKIKTLTLPTQLEFVSSRRWNYTIFTSEKKPTVAYLSELKPFGQFIYFNCKPTPQTADGMELFHLYQGLKLLEEAGVEIADYKKHLETSYPPLKEQYGQYLKLLQLI